MSRLPPSAAIEALLSDLGPQLLRRGGDLNFGRGGDLNFGRGGDLNSAYEPPGHFQTGVPEVDRLLRGGIPFGALSEISGPPSSGRTSLALTLLAKVTRAGELVGEVDAVDAFDPLSAERAGVDLDRVLWVRAKSWREALRCSERLLQTEGFPLVLLDWTTQPSESVPTAAWIRLTRMAASSRTAMLLLSTERLAGSHAELALEMQIARARFSDAPALLEELETRAVLVRHRTAPIGQTSATFVRASTSMAFPESPHESAA